MKNNIWMYIIIMALVTYLIRVLPLTIIRKEIKNKWIRSFLYYVPYVTLSVMTFPSILTSTASPVSGMLALLVGIFLAWKGLGLFPVSVLACITVFITELFI